ncbi:hypothetical protein ACA910_001951 [Epithemia clementina (nom. ined.)]
MTKNDGGISVHLLSGINYLLNTGQWVALFAFAFGTLVPWSQGYYSIVGMPGSANPFGKFHDSQMPYTSAAASTTFLSQLQEKQRKFVLPLLMEEINGQVSVTIVTIVFAPSGLN